MTYFHQALYYDIPPSTPLKKRLSLRAKGSFLKFLRANTDAWAVQSEAVRDRLGAFLGGKHQPIIVAPLYPNLPTLDTLPPRQSGRFLFVSDGNPHKNHRRLLEAFAQASQKQPSLELHLTVSEHYPEVQAEIKRLQDQGLRILNHGRVPRSEIARLYAAAEFVIYPSLAESFGLGLLEGLEMGCKIVGADLPYVHAVCKPSNTFDPSSVEDIRNALLAPVQQSVPASEARIGDQTQKLLEFLEL